MSNKRSRQNRYSYPFIKDVLRRTKLPRLYALVVTLQEDIGFKYDLFVDLVKFAGNSLVVTLQERILTQYDLIVSLQKSPPFSLIVELIGVPIIPRSLVVQLQEAVLAKHSLVVSLVEGGTESGCISLDC